jgi:hypothetical protein
MHLCLSLTVLLLAHAPKAHPPGASQAPGSPRGVHATLSWVHQPASLAEMVRVADTIVVASFLGGIPGRTVVANGRLSVSFEVNQFQATEVLKGSASEEILSVERVSGHGPVGGETLPVIGPDGPYETGKTYLLFLKRQPGGDLHTIVNGEGRYWIGEEERVRPHGAKASETQGRVSREIRGRPLARVRQLVRAAVHAR